MKKYFVVAIALMAVLAVAMPASAKVEFSYGGLFRARVFSEGDFANPISSNTVDQFGQALPAPDRRYFDNDENTRNRLDQRLRLYFTFTASENLKLVTKFEANEIWGDLNSSGRIGADHPNDFVVKNSYLDFNIPNGMAPINAKVGIQTITLFNSWVIDDDFASANVAVKLDPFKLTLGYIAGQNDDQFNEKENVDDFIAVVDYVCGPWSASLGTVIQFGHDTFASADPSTVSETTPVTFFAGNYVPAVGSITTGPRQNNTAFNNARFEITGANNFFQRYFTNPFGSSFAPNDGVGIHHLTASDNNLIDLALSLNYKVDFMSAYLNFVRNFGKIHIQAFRDNMENGLGSAQGFDFDYEGWMIDAGGSYFCGPFTFNMSGFYTSGPEDIKDSLRGVPGLTGPGAVAGKKTGDIDWFTYPLGNSKYFSEIIGGGIFDPIAPKHEDLQWRGYPNPTNLWTINAGAAWQVLPSTKLAFSYWYFGTAEDVVSGPRNPNSFAPGGINNIRGFNARNEFLTQYFRGEVPASALSFDSEIGHEFNLNMSHKIVDGLMLDLVAAYLIAGDAYSMRADDLDAIELGARLQWTF